MFVSSASAMCARWKRWCYRCWRGVTEASTALWMRIRAPWRYKSEECHLPRPTPRLATTLSPGPSTTCSLVALSSTTTDDAGLTSSPPPPRRPRPSRQGYRPTHKIGLRLSHLPTSLLIASLLFLFLLLLLKASPRFCFDKFNNYKYGRFSVNLNYLASASHISFISNVALFRVHTCIVR